MPMSNTVASDVPSVSIFLEVCIEKRAREIHYHEKLWLPGGYLQCNPEGAQWRPRLLELEPEDEEVAT